MFLFYFYFFSKNVSKISLKEQKSIKYTKKQTRNKKQKTIKPQTTNYKLQTANYKPKMDATKVLSQLTNTWNNCLGEYYDHVATEHLKTISEKFGIPVEDLQEKTSGLKEGIMAKLTNCMPTKTADTVNEATSSKQPAAKKKAPQKEKEVKLGRKELQGMCKERGIPTKKKNSDMIDAIAEYDKNNCAKEEVAESDPEPEQEEVAESDPEPEQEDPHAKALQELAELKKSLKPANDDENETEQLSEDEYPDEDDL